MMSISSSTKKDFTKVFPYSTLTAASGKPTYAAIEKTQRKIFTCASSIASLRGGGQHGKLGLVMTPSSYDLFAPATPYIRPVHISPYLWRHDPTQNSLEWSTVHRTRLRLQKHQPTWAATDQPPALRLRPKMACIHHGPRHRPDQQTTTSNLLSPLHKLWTNHSNRTEPETRRMYKYHLQSQHTHRLDLGPNL